MAWAATISGCRYNPGSASYRCVRMSVFVDPACRLRVRFERGLRFLRGQRRADYRAMYCGIEMRTSVVDC